MAKKTINLGTPPSGVGGDTARAAFEKVNSNFDELYDHAQQGMDALSAHAGNTDNPHGVDKEQVGLGKVENYPIASVEQAKSGSGDAFMTPALVHEAFKQYGLGTHAVTIQDANSIRTSGFFKTGASWEGSVFPGAHGFNQGVLLHHGHGPNYGVQYFHPMQSHGYYARFLDNGVWSDWARIYNSHTILGTVSQSNGVPTGAIIERGSNSNGEYVRFADGTQICFHNSTATFSLTPYSTTGLYSGQVSWTFPAAFVKNPEGVGGSGGDSGAHGWVGGGSSGPAAAALRYFTVSSAITAAAIRMIAIGRWY